MLRKFRFAFIAALGLAAFAHAGSTIATGIITGIEYRYSTGGKLQKAILTLDDQAGSLDFISLSAPSGYDIKDYRSLSHGLSVAETAKHDYQTVTVSVTTSSSNCVLEQGGPCGNTVSVSSTTAFTLFSGNN